MIYKGTELICTQEELNAFVSGLQITSRVCDFSEPYNGVMIENPTNNSEAKYYIIESEGRVILQPHDPFQAGFAAITDANVAETINRHKDSLVDAMVLSVFAVKPEDKIKQLEQQLAIEQTEKEQIKGQLKTLTETVDYLLGV